MKRFWREALRGYWIGLGLAVLTIAGCATTFPWRYYTVQMPGECYDAGKLLGKEGSDGWPDQKLSECKPDPSPTPGATVQPKLAKCIAVEIDDFYAIKADGEKCHKDLQLCQQGPTPQPTH